MGPESNMTGVLRKRNTQGDGSRDRRVATASQGTAGDTKSERVKKGFSLQSLRREHGLADTLILDVWPLEM